MSCVAQRRGAADLAYSRVRLKSVLNEADYLAVLNQRLRAHPMYLEGMAFPVASDDEHAPADDEETEVQKLPLVELLLDTQWDRFGVFASVIDDVRRSYELASAIAPQSPVPGCQRLASQAVKSRRQRV
jgi:hypothetical protein